MKVPAGNRSPAEAPASQKGTMTSINPPRPSLCTAMALLKHAIAACSDTRAISWREKRSLQGSRCGVGGHVPTKSSGCRATPGATADGRSGLPGHVRVQLSRSAPRLRGPVQVISLVVALGCADNTRHWHFRKPRARGTEFERSVQARTLVPS